MYLPVTGFEPRASVVQDKCVGQQLQNRDGFRCNFLIAEECMECINFSNKQ